MVLRKRDGFVIVTQRKITLRIGFSFVAFLIPEDGFQTLTGQSVAIGPHGEVSEAPPSHATFVVMVTPKNLDVCYSNRIYRALG